MHCICILFLFFYYGSTMTSILYVVCECKFARVDVYFYLLLHCSTVNPFSLYMLCSIERVYPPVGCACARLCLHTWECVVECVCTRVPHTWEYVFECVCTCVPPHVRVHLRVRVFLLRIFIGLQQRVRMWSRCLHHVWFGECACVLGLHTL